MSWVKAVFLTLIIIGVIVIAPVLWIILGLVALVVVIHIFIQPDEPPSD